MISAATRAKYRATIGIECHVQLKTKSKLFSGAGNDARSARPNTLVNHIDFGLPGALPVLNKEAVHLASRAAFALGSAPQKFSKFDRKHYFYPDLPMGYQITQYDEPIILGGSVAIEVDGQQKTVGITRAHLEADAGKSTHPAGEDYSLVDLNRAGTPLLEIVSEPDMHSAADAKAYARELYLRMRYADVSDANLYYGNMRFDVNVSVSQTDELGTRSETKNLNSFRAVEKTVEYEIERQIELLEKGGTVAQETRGWDDAKQKTFSQRSKENADDYRYMPDPDLPPVELEDAYIEKIKHEMPVMPNEWRERLGSLNLEKAQIETLLEAEVESSVNYLKLIEKSIENDRLAQTLANWFVNLEIPLRRNETVKIIEMKTEDRLKIYRSVYELVEEGKLSSTNAKALLAKCFTAPTIIVNITDFAQKENLIQVSDEGEIAKIVEQVLAENAKAAEDVKNGEMKAVGFLVGQVMKASKGKANPQLAQDLIMQQLGLT
ncbi:MAG TPA: Asp-tRNA(Asn)/Glu-tRNA(Gln) amidotransferase subunit GatB [Candidatus Saccharimonadales bacterium]|nr:Asp-tRNA(Asn)/Glu-tRNA(Gln) amidotransferase subunit GatB [Candidatus Saccharimonadales bacterium]